MCSAARLAANRRNAAASTGPKSAAGKQRVSQNARTHGLRAHSEILTPADQHEIAKITNEFAKDFESAQVAQLAKAYWNLKRFDALEDEVFDGTETNPEEITCRLYNLSRYRARHQRLFHQSLAQCIAAQSHKQSQSPNQNAHSPDCPPSRKEENSLTCQDTSHPIHPIYPSQVCFPRTTQPPALPPRGIIPLEWTFTTKSSASGVSARSAHSPPSSKFAVPYPVMKAPSYSCARTVPWPAP